MESGGIPLLCRRHVAAGLVFWAVFCVAAVPLRGVRWDEQYEFAQVITRTVVYPEGHPYPYCVQNALNLQIYSTAAIHWLTRNPAIVCGFRNVMYLLATTIPVFLLGSLLGRRALAGHAAVLLILLGVHEEFDACYQMFAWPQYASTGHVGLGYALTALALLAGGHLRTGLFLLGLMPCIHIGQMPILLGTAILAGAPILFKDRASLKPVIKALTGLLACAAIWAARGAVNIPLSQSGPYASTADASAVWAGYIAQDPLRALTGSPTSYTSSFVALAAALILATLLCFMSREETKSARNPKSIVWLYVVLACIAVWGVMAVHYALRDCMPYVLISWMPYRFANHAVYILLAATAAVLCGSQHRSLWVMPAALFLGSLRPFLAHVLPATVFTRYVAGGEAILFFLIGAACFALLIQLRPANKKLYAGAWAAVGLSMIPLGAVHQFGLASTIVGIAVAAAANRWHTDRPPTRASYAPAILTALALIGVTVTQLQARQHLPASQFDRDLAAYLAEHGDAHAMLLARPEQYTLQARTGHPVVADTCLAPWIPYMPAIGPTIQKIHQDFYGESFSPPSKAEWSKLWINRTLADWQDLARIYNVYYVVSPHNVRLQLPVAIRGPMETLYRIPETRR